MEKCWEWNILLLIYFYFYGAQPTNETYEKRGYDSGMTRENKGWKKSITLNILELFYILKASSKWVNWDNNNLLGHVSKLYSILRDNNVPRKMKGWYM